MRRLSILLGLILSTGSIITTAPPAHSQTPAHVWSKSFGATGNDTGYSVAADGSGNVYVTGIFQGPADFGGGPLANGGGWDVFLAKYDASGVHQWSHGFGGSYNDVGFSVAVDGSGNVYVTGMFFGTADLGGGPLVSAGYQDIFLAKYDASGVHQWSKSFGSAESDGGNDVAVDGSGNVYLTGSFWGAADFGGGDLVSVGTYDIFLAKFNTAGVYQWSQNFGGLYPDDGLAVAVDGSGNVVVAGRFKDAADFGGGPLASVGDDDIFLAKFNAVGVHQWSHRFGGTGRDFGSSVAVDGSGNVVVTGGFVGTADFGGDPLVSTGSQDIFLARYDAAGVHQWSKRLGGTNDDAGTSVAVDGAGNSYLTGFFNVAADLGGGNLVSAGNQDIYLAKYDAAGAHLWSEPFGGTVTDYGLSVALDGAANVLMTGWFGGVMDFGGGNLVSAGGQEIFLAKFASTYVSTAITSFDASAGLDQVNLRAAFRSDLGATAVNVYRGDEETGAMRRIDTVAPEIDHFEFTDRSVVPGATYRYQIGVVDPDGEFYSPVVRVTVAPLSAALAQNTPNPFNPTTTIEYVLPEHGRVALRVYGADGALVRTLVDDVIDAGVRDATWDGRDDRGRAVPSGVYFYRLEAGRFRDSKKMVLLK